MSDFRESRRDALKSMALAGAAAALLPRQSQAESNDQRWKTAIGLNGFQSGSRKYQKNYPIWEVLDFAARSGFEGVELVADWPQGGYPKAFNEAAKIAADAGILACFEIEPPFVHASLKCKRVIDEAWASS